MKDTFTREEVIQLLIKERQRAVDIADSFSEQAENQYNDFKEAEKITKSESIRAIVLKDVANECRLVGNAISGLNALSVTLGKTMENEIRKEFDKLYPPQN
jgi:hypothetical protein